MAEAALRAWLSVEAKLAEPVVMQVLPRMLAQHIYTVDDLVEWQKEEYGTLLDLCVTPLTARKVERALARREYGQAEAAGGGAHGGCSSTSWPGFWRRRARAGWR